MRPQSWRDCDAWREENLPMNTSSNEACKLYDITLSQLVSWRQDQQIGGIESSIEKMLIADNSFVLGHVLKSGVDLIGSSSCLNKEYSKSIKELSDLTERLSSGLTKRELSHVAAIKHLYNGNIDKSCEYWEDILIENPNDMLAIKFAHDTYFYLGQHAQMRDSIARVLPNWSSWMPLYSYLHGMHSFGLVQSNFFEQAKQSAMLALDLNLNDAWATHTICHYNEYKNDFNSGIKFLRATESFWSVCDLISPHNYWHLCLYHIERNEHETALEIFDEISSRFLNLNRTLDMIDLASLLFRLELAGCKENLDARWLKLKEVYRARISDHGYTFNDSHVCMILSACGDKEEKETFLRSLDEYLNQDQHNFILDSCNNIIKDSNNHLKHVNKYLGEKIFNSIFLYNQKEFDKVVDILNPIRYDLIKIGGSNAQRDLFHQMLVSSSLQSNSIAHKKLGLALINERLSLKPDSNLTKRLFKRL